MCLVVSLRGAGMQFLLALERAWPKNIKQKEGYGRCVEKHIRTQHLRE